MSRLVLDHLTKSFNDAVAVDDVSIDLEEGEFLALLGPSGCGKTTTLRMVAGLVRPDSGHILLDGRDITGQPPRARGLAMVFQAYALFPHLTIFENVAFGLRLRKRPQEEIRARVREALLLVRLEGMQARYPRQLSGGQQQRVSLARAIVIEPRVLLFDEPLSNLDAKLRETMREEIRAIQKRLGITSLYVTHDQAEALAVADRIAVMHAGRIQQLGTPSEVYEQPANLFVADFIGSTNILRGRVAQRDGQLLLAGERGWELPLPPSAVAHVGEDTTVTIRPERVRLEPASDRTTGAPSSSFGQVEGRTYLGSQLHVRVMTPAGALLATMPNTGDWQPAEGQQVRVGVRPSDCVVLGR